MTKMSSTFDRRLRRHDGLSLVEVLASTLVFAVISFGIASSTVTTIRTNRASEHKAVAVNLVHQVLECVLSQIRAGRAIDATNAGADCNPAGAPAGYALVIPPPSAGAGAFADMTRVQVTISWRSPLPDRIRFDSYVDT